MRKAMAEVAAINGAINAAITAGTLPMGTPLATIATQPNTIVLRDSNGKPIIDPVTMLPAVRQNGSCAGATDISDARRGSNRARHVGLTGLGMWLRMRRT